MTEPRPIEPQDIRVGMRVRCEWSFCGVDHTADYTVDNIVDGKPYSIGGVTMLGVGPNATWTLLADAPKPDRPVGSHWRDPETGAEYVRTDGGTYRRYVRGSSSGLNLVPGDHEDDAIIARLTPIPAFDPAVLWPVRNPNDRRCPDYVQPGGIGFTCSREKDHDGMHAAYTSYAEGVQPAYVWGRP